VNVRTKKSNSNISTWFAFGCLYQRTKQELNNIAAEGGGEITASELAGWMAELLSAEASRSILGSTEHMPQVRRDSAEGHASASEKALHVRSRKRRTLSKKALKAISDAQKKRWKKYHAKKVGKKLKSYWSKMSAEDRKIEMRRRILKRNQAA